MSPNSNQFSWLQLQPVHVVRYAAEYVCRKVYKEISGSTQPNKEELLQAIMNLVDMNRGQAASLAPTTEWIKAVDRDGLWHVTEGTFMLFQAMEEEVWEHFQMAKVSAMSEGCRATVVKSVTENEDVAFYWCMLTTEITSNDADVLIHMLVELRVTIRGFSFTSGWVELYKEFNKKNLQHSKSLRKEIT